MPQEPPKSIVVIHGVGDQKEEETARDLARALGGVFNPDLKWAPPTYVLKRGDILSESRASGRPEAFSFGAYTVFLPDRPEGRRVPVYEMYWANLSRPGQGILGEFRNTWQFLVGLPRIGFQALTIPVPGAGGAFLGLVRLVYCLAWLLLVARMLVALILIAAISQLEFTWLRYYDIIFAFDLAITLTFLVLAAALAALALFGAEGRMAAWVSRWGLVALTLTCLLTQAVPLTVLELTGFDAKAYELEPWIKFKPEGFASPWFYGLTSFPGFTPYVAYGMIVAWAAVGLRYLFQLGRRKYPATFGPVWSPADLALDKETDTWMRRVTWLSHVFWVCLAFLVLVVWSAFFWRDFVCLQFLHQRPWYLYEPRPQRQGPSDILIQGIAILFVTKLVYLFLFVVWGVAFWPWLRATIAPALELAFDVSGYFPAIPGLDEPRGLRYLLGGRHAPSPAADGSSGLRRLIRGDVRPPGPGPLQRALFDRLRRVILFAYKMHGSPVAVIGHSLGSMIALSALEDWGMPEEPPSSPDDEPGQAATRERAAQVTTSDDLDRPPDDLRIDLVTMGSPFRALGDFFPHLYGRIRHGGGWSLPRLRSWLNLYRGADLIGRDLPFDGVRSPSPIKTRNAPLGSGGHLGYFADERMAAYLVRWLFHEIPNAP